MLLYRSTYLLNMYCNVEAIQTTFRTRVRIPASPPSIHLLSV